MSKEQAVRDAAAKLQDAILDARASGLVVTWPARVEDLAFVAVSEGRKALTPEEVGQAAKAAAEREQAVGPREVTTLRIGVDSSRVEDAVRQIQNASTSSEKAGKAVDQLK